MIDIPACPTGLPLTHWEEDLLPLSPSISNTKKPSVGALVPDFGQKIEVHKAPPEFRHFKMIDRIVTKSGPSDFPNQEDRWQYLPFECFQQFSFNDIARLTFFYPDSELYPVIAGTVGHNLDLVSFRRYILLRKTRLSMQHWGRGDEYNLFVYYFNCIRRFDFGLPDFEARFDCTRFGNSSGLSEYSGTWLDGDLAFNILYQGRHVLTIGYNVTNGGVIVPQIQVNAKGSGCKKKGNRWLYRIPGDHIDYCLQRMSAAFPDSRLWLVDGQSLVDTTMKNYVQPDTMFPDDARLHVVNTYKRSLPTFRRSGYRKFRSLLFHRLVPRNAELMRKSA